MGVEQTILFFAVGCVGVDSTELASLGAFLKKLVRLVLFLSAF